MSKIDSKKIRRFHRLLFSWYRKNQRDLPWRKTHDPYKILVSEVMLQQTQVDRVIPKYLEFICRYPTAQSLARASVADVLRLWSGLGYNRRAVYLKKAAQVIVHEWHGRWPQTVQELLRLPAVGHYTAAAILSFAFEQDVPLVEVNIERIVGRMFVGPSWPRLSEKKMLRVVERILPHGKSRIFPHALMDLGAALARRDSSLAIWQEEFPELFVSEKKKIMKKERWIGSNRQLRGAILRSIQEGRVSMKQLARDLTISRHQLLELIRAMARDGLVQISKETVSLPR